jgi:hypothetical protein
VLPADIPARKTRLRAAKAAARPILAISAGSGIVVIDLT